MSKTLLNGILSRVIKHGTLAVQFSDGTSASFGSKVKQYPDVAVRFSDAKVPRDIIMDLRLGAAEAFMDGRLVIEKGDVMALVTLLRANDRWEKGRNIPNASAFKRLINSVSFAIDRVNNRISAKKNVAHHYDIGNDLYSLMLDSEH